MTSPGNRKIGIVGGGMLGLTLALRLAESGFNVTVLEKSTGIGGVLKPARIGNYSWDQFYHVILLSDMHLRKLIEELGLTDRIEWGETRTGFYTDGRLYSMSNTLEFLSFPPLSLFDKLRLGFTIFYASRIKNWEKLEDFTVSDWLIRLSGQATFDKIWLPLLKSKLGEYYKITSAAFIWAAIARMYSARRTGLKKEMFGYIKGGYDHVLNRFDEILSQKGVNVLLETEVREIAHTEGEVRCIAGGRTLDYDAVIMTLPSTEIPALVPAMTEREKKQMLSTTYESVICPTYLLRKPLAGFYVMNITDGHLPFTGVIEMTALMDRNYFDGHSLVYLPRYLAFEDPLWSKGDKEITEDFLSALEVIYPALSGEDVVASSLSRARNVMPVPTLNYSKKVLPSTITSIGNIFIVNSAQIANGTMNINEIVGLAERKAVEVSNILYRST
jgi:protoporphyrinogen oxidase